MVNKGKNNFKNILAIRLDNMGDLLMTTPALRAIKESCPSAKLTLLGSTGGSKIAKFIPEIDDTITFEAPWVKSANIHSDSGETFKLIKLIESRRFDAAIVFTVYSQNPMPAVMIAFLANIHRRIAYSHEKCYQLITDYKDDLEPQEFVIHEVQRQLNLVKILGFETKQTKLSLNVPLSGRRKLVDVLLKLGVNLQKPWVIIHTTATSKKRIYSPKGFAEIGKMFSQKLSYQVLFTGIKGEIEYISKIYQQVGKGSFLLAGKIDLPELINLIYLSPLLISNNSGPVHIASSLGTPVIDLYSRTNPQHIPWQVKNKVLYFDPPIDGKDFSLNQVPPETVFKTSLEMLSTSQSDRLIKNRTCDIDLTMTNSF